MVLYSLVDYGIMTHSFSALISSDIPVITIMYRIAGPVALPLLLFAAINDGILGSLAFLTAFSRNLYAMSDRGLISKNKHITCKNRHTSYRRVNNINSSINNTCTVIGICKLIYYIPCIGINCRPGKFNGSFNSKLFIV